MADAVNPYATPKATVDDVGSGAPSEAESLRREHLKHEASLKAVGLLYAFGGSLNLLAGVIMLIPAMAGGGKGSDGVALIALFLAAIGGFGLWIGLRLRRLDPRAKTPAIVLSALGLLAFPLGTLINGYILWLLLSKKGGVILSPAYAAIVEATPHIRYRTPAWVWIALGLIVLLVVAAVIVPVLTR